MPATIHVDRDVDREIAHPPAVAQVPCSRWLAGSVRAVIEVFIAACHVGAVPLSPTAAGPARAFFWPKTTIEKVGHKRDTGKTLASFFTKSGQQKTPFSLGDKGLTNGAANGTRTRDPRIHNPVL